MLRLMLGAVLAVGLAGAPAVEKYASVSVGDDTTPIALELEQRTTIRVGQVAVLNIPSDRRYEVQSARTTAGGTLRLVRRSKRSVLYRAIRPGKDVIVVSPVTKSGECISCATLHYYIDVIR